MPSSLTPEPRQPDTQAQQPGTGQQQQARQARHPSRHLEAQQLGFSDWLARPPQQLANVRRKAEEETNL